MNGESDDMHNGLTATGQMLILKGIDYVRVIFMQ